MPSSLQADEPTASLSAHEASELRRIARNLGDSGVCVVYISHRLEEVFEIGDRVSVIRDGRHISTRPIAEKINEIEKARTAIPTLTWPSPIAVSTKKPLVT